MAINNLSAYADIGETAAMLLYKELNANYLLVDDKQARKVATINDIKIIGSLGVLIQAKRKGLISSVHSRVLQIKDSPVFISEELIKTVLEIAGEPAN